MAIDSSMTDLCGVSNTAASISNSLSSSSMSIGIVTSCGGGGAAGGGYCGTSGGGLAMSGISDINADTGSCHFESVSRWYQSIISYFLIISSLLDKYH